MWAWYEKYYKIRDNEKISDQKMMVRFVVTLVIIIVCLLGMSATSIAFYTVSIETGSNTVTPSTFYVLPEVTASKGKEAELDAQYNTVYKCVYHLSADSECTFTLKLPDNQTNLATTGYCRVRVGDTTFYTKQFGKDVLDVGSTQPTTRTTVNFVVKTASAVDVTIEPCWGTCALTPIQDSGYQVNLS